MTVSLTQVKAQLRVTNSDSDTYITDLITRAKAWTERYIGQNIVAAAVTDTFTAFGDYLLLSRGPLNSLTTIAYTDADGGDAELDTDTVRTQDGRFYPPSDGWPSIADYSTITVTYDAGFATTPADIDAGMLLLIGHWYEHREAVVFGATTFEVQYAVDSLLGPFRLPTLR